MIINNAYFKMGVEVHAYNPSTWEAEARGSKQAWATYQGHSLKKKKKKKKNKRNAYFIKQRRGPS
jgi:hypothetical protein